MRKIAVLADIHSNHIALERCISEAKHLGAEEFLFLGDYLGDLGCPGQTLDLLDALQKEVPCTFIRGNKEDYWIDHRAGTDDWNWEYGTSGSGMLQYTYDRLTPAQIESFAELPILRRMHYEGMPDFVICHGSPFHVRESMREDYYYNDDLTRRLETELTICAHFHVQTAYAKNGKRVINPGSVGMPLRSGGRTQFMMLTDEGGKWEKEFHTLEYDVEAVVREMDEERLNEIAPGWYRVTKAVLRGGDLSQSRVLTKAHQFYQEAEGVSDWRSIPEKYWEMALGEYGV
ncbi:MAG: metallophosphatase family protein [Lachnospiraceae bacterium]|nr:metallophosphatase family protein [Lachnospiraceae bacterium]